MKWFFPVSCCSPAVVLVSSWSKGSVTLKAKAVAGGTSILQGRDSDFLQLLQLDFMGCLELGGK